MSHGGTYILAQLLRTTLRPLELDARARCPCSKRHGGVRASLALAAALGFRQMVDEMNAFFAAHELPSRLCVRVREYLYAQRECRLRLESSRGLNMLSPSLQVEVLMCALLSQPLSLPRRTAL